MVTTQFRAYILALLPIFVLFCLGCGNGYVKLQGKVTFEEDGTPLTSGRVCFQTATFMAEGKIKEDGTYIMGSISENDGLPKGTYKVFVAGAVDDKFPPGGGEPSYRPLIDQKYASFDTTTLTCDVPAPGNRFDFTVKKP